MRQKPGTPKPSADRVVKHIRRRRRKAHSAEESERAARHRSERAREPASCSRACAARSIRLVAPLVRATMATAELCRREGIATSPYDGWSKAFLAAGKKRLAGDSSASGRHRSEADAGRARQAAPK